MAKMRKNIYHGSARGKRNEIGTVGAAETLAQAIVLANECSADYTAHIADTDAHTTAADETNVVTEDDATTLATLITLVTELLTIYDAHQVDAQLASSWAFHAADIVTDLSLDSAVAPTTLEECYTKLADLKVKYNAHDLNGTAHGTPSANPVEAASVGTVAQEINFEDANIVDITLSAASALTVTLVNPYDGAEVLLKITSANATDTLALQVDSTSCTAQASTSFTANDVNYAKIVVIDADNDVSVVHFMVS